MGIDHHPKNSKKIKKLISTLSLINIIDQKPKLRLRFFVNDFFDKFG